MGRSRPFRFLLENVDVCSGSEADPRLALEASPPSTQQRTRMPPRQAYRPEAARLDVARGRRPAPAPCSPPPSLPRTGFASAPGNCTASTKIPWKAGPVASETRSMRRAMSAARSRRRRRYRAARRRIAVLPRQGRERRLRGHIRLFPPQPHGLRDRASGS